MEIFTALIIAAVIWCLCSKGGGKPAPRMRMTYHDVGRVPAKRVKIHEEHGHKRAANRLRCYGKVVECSDGGYEFKPTGGRWGQLTPVEQAAIYYAGRAAAGPGGHEEDNQGAEWWLRKVPSSQRGAARREAWRLAERLVR